MPPSRDRVTQLSGPYRQGAICSPSKVVLSAVRADICLGPLFLGGSMQRPIGFFDDIIRSSLGRRELLTINSVEEQMRLMMIMRGNAGAPGQFGRARHRAHVPS